MSLTIRSANAADIQGILSIYRPIIEETNISFEYEVPSQEEMQLRVEKVQKEGAWLVCCEGDVVAGYAYAGAHRGRPAYQWNRELSVYVSSVYRKRGVASGLYNCLFEIIFLQGFTNALAGITMPNDASVSFHKKMGFSIVGTYRDIGFKNGRYHDVSWWQKKLSNKSPGGIRNIGGISDQELQMIYRRAENSLQ